MYKKYNKIEDTFISKLIGEVRDINRRDMVRTASEKKGLTYLMNIGHKGSLYINNDCQHVLIRQYDAIISQKKVWCRECSTESWKKINENKGITFLTKTSGVCALYRIEKCGHFVNRSMGNPLEGSSEIPCLECQRELYFNTWKRLEISLLEYSCDPTRPKVGHFKRNRCGHTFKTLRHKVQKEVNCRECIKDRFKSVIIAHNLTELEKVSTRRSLFKLPCGHSREIAYEALERGNFVCQECNDSFLNKPSFLYIFKIETTDGLSFIKAGYGKSLANRKREYRLKGVKTFELLYSKELPTGRLAMELERNFHKNNLDKRLSPITMNKYLTKGGYTECYPTNMLDTIKSYFNKEYSYD